LIRGIIFDFDGLILDTESTVYQSWREFYQQYGQELPFEEWGQVIGRSSNEHFDPLARLEALLGQELDRAAGEQRLQRELELVMLQPILPGVLDYLNAARRLGLKLAVASSSDIEWVGWHLDRLDLRRYFNVVHTSDDVTQTKPHPELFQLALASLGLAATEAIVLEDSSNGVTAAKQAGIFCVAVPNALTRQLPLDHADLRLNSLAEISLERLLQNIDREDFK
jgi:HAD superfamily hydrolase (TIGR01509 family)